MKQQAGKERFLFSPDYGNDVAGFWQKRLHEKVYFFGRHKIQRHESVSVDCSGGGPIYYHGRVAKRVSFHRMMKNSKACIVFFNLIFEKRKKHLDLLSKFLLILVFRFNAMFC